MSSLEIPEKMKAAVLVGPNNLQIQEVDVPTPGSFEVLIKVMACAICGSDPTVLAGNWPNQPPFGSFTPGHEYSGQIVATGPHVTQFAVGDRVAIETHKGCGYCENCKRGRYTICLNYGKNETGHRHYGFTTNGGYAQYAINHVSTLYKIAENVEYDEAALVTTAACVHFALDNLGGLLGGESVAVLGPGPIGLMAVQLTKALGATKVILTGTRENRLEVGKQVGADAVVNVNEEDPIEAVMRETDGLGVDVVIECSGSKIAAEQAFQMPKRGGKISLIGDPHEPASVDLRKFVLDDFRAAGVRGEGMGDCKRSLALFSAGKIQAKPLITHYYRLDEIDQAFETYLGRIDGAIKVIIHPNE